MQGPLIGVTGDDGHFPVAWWFIRWALWRCGARACRMTPRRDVVEAVDGLIVSGGDDIDPGLYLPHDPERAPINPERDRFEIEVLEIALPADLPVLGICRGAQLLNVVLGGSLLPDLRPLRRRTSNRRTPLARKTLLVESGSALEGILGASRLRINSLHHQAIDRLGEGLTVCGRDLDGFVQAVESPGRRFLKGVQWHPEYLPTHSAQINLFRSLVRAASPAGRREC